MTAKALALCTLIDTERSFKQRAVNVRFPPIADLRSVCFLAVPKWQRSGSC